MIDSAVVQRTVTARVFHVPEKPPVCSQNPTDLGVGALLHYDTECRVLNTLESWALSVPLSSPVETWRLAYGVQGPV